MLPFNFRLFDLNSECFRSCFAQLILSLFTRIFELNSEYIFHLVEISIVNLSVKFMSIGSKQRIFPFTFRLYDLNRKYFLSLLVQSSRSRQCSVCENNINITFFLVKLIFGFWYGSHNMQGRIFLSYYITHFIKPYQDLVHL